MQEAHAMTDSVFALNRDLLSVDNLQLMQRMDNETVDLICADPPFVKNSDFQISQWAETVSHP